ncbi:EAL domain-containing protein [Altererythrobacter xixiisoli]|uniref:EAL domain-containing protein n=1 Tax=Croceibacterium xixiisoli TaxID=1476466 RepID=A0A6I4TSF2_9SPHN|nr:GGDEF and EAL domain-containing protein [Croceibacterium xixiisoli]MXO99065.1 EAL domain-containing protein [Croceibacterium xixiisoli]
MKGLLKGLGVRSAATPAADAPTGSGNPVDRLAMLDLMEEGDLAWFWATDAAGTLVYLSPNAQHKLPAGASVVGQPFLAMVDDLQDAIRDHTPRSLNFLFNAHSRFSDRPVGIMTARGKAFWALSGRPLTDEDGNFQGYRGSARDITGSYQEQHDSSRMAVVDALTGLANRNRMNLRLASMLASFRAARRSCALLTLNLDRFKQVNEAKGMLGGDDLLRQAAQRLQRIVPDSAEIGRLGADEFQILLPDCDDRGTLGDLALRIIQMLSQPYTLNDGRAVVGVSMGVSIAPYDGVEAEDLVKSASLALDAVKSSGRGQYRFYSNDLKDAVQQERQIEDDLREALAGNQLAMHYQPIVGAKDNKVVCFEALMRWDHPVRGMISPAKFIPIAEKSDLIGPLGEWALRRACQDAAKWPGRIRVAVNVSAAQFTSEAMPEMVSSALADSGLDPHLLELEMTESVFMGNLSAVEDVIAKLRQIGVRLALDDFGTGYSSLGSLRQITFDKIKIDRGFVRGCTEPGSVNAAIISAVVRLAQALDMDTTVEGVEAMDELEVVRDLGVKTVQGFIYSRAVSQADVLSKLAVGDFEYHPVGPAKYRAERRTLFRKVGVVHENHRYQAVLRNLSRSGALIEGLLDVPVGTDLVLDLGDGQLVVATVRRSHGASQGLEFETHLISDGADGLCTRHRASPYLIAAAGLPLQALPAGYQHRPEQRPGYATIPRFMQVDMLPASIRAA